MKIIRHFPEIYRVLEKNGTIGTQRPCSCRGFCYESPNYQLIRYYAISEQLFFYKFIRSDIRSPKCRHFFSHDSNSELYVSGFIWSGSRSSRNIYRFPKQSMSM